MPIQPVLSALFEREPEDEPTDYSATYTITPQLAAELGGLDEYVGYVIEVGEDPNTGTLEILNVRLPQPEPRAGSLFEQYTHATI
jgi:hypothetical protein